MGLTREAADVVEVEAARPGVVAMGILRSRTLSEWAMVRWARTRDMTDKAVLSEVRVDTATMEGTAVTAAGTMELQQHTVEEEEGMTRMVGMAMEVDTVARQEAEDVSKLG